MRSVGTTAGGPPTPCITGDGQGKQCRLPSPERGAGRSGLSVHLALVASGVPPGEWGSAAGGSASGTRLGASEMMQQALAKKRDAAGRRGHP